MYIYIYILNSSRKPSGRFLMVSVVDIIQRLFMVSVVGFVWFPSSQENFVFGFRRRIFDGFCRRRRIQFLEGIE